MDFDVHYPSRQPKCWRIWASARVFSVLEHARTGGGFVYPAGLARSGPHPLQLSDGAPFPAAAGHPTGMAQLTERALELVPENSPAAGRLLAIFGWLIGMEQGNYASGSDAVNRGLAIARRHKDINVELRILVNAAELEAYNHRWQASLGRALEAVELTHRVNDPRSEMLARRSHPTAEQASEEPGAGW